ncbi:hypothetical protein SAMN06893096_104188 [Geodermatophilus pulveris]|uniref:Uncharacterized protein n=1 Tax=Geodermatophilus pulveris TaxID=1564159 RepID=A0A239ELZ4_9ACTN|nr:hypothetical protein [Geodermatophilus pulveris]SNS45421.1 hypothetical protein SAMN06893096_104188 [Geodermatophilus pulveris]
MFIDCDTCTARGTGCGDCVLTVLLGAPPGWQGSDPVVVPAAGRWDGGLTAEDVVVVPRPGTVVEFDEVERRAVRVLADAGLVPPLRHQSAPHQSAPHRSPARRPAPERRSGGAAARRRTG